MWLFSQQLQLVLRRASLPIWIWEIFGKMLPPELQKLLFRKRFLLCFRGLLLASGKAKALLNNVWTVARGGVILPCANAFPRPR